MVAPMWRWGPRLRGYSKSARSILRDGSRANPFPVDRTASKRSRGLLVLVVSVLVVAGYSLDVAAQAGPSTDLVTESPLLVLPEPSISVAASPLPKEAPLQYVDEKEGDWVHSLMTFLSRKVAPALPGAILLLFFSTFFSTVNFFSEIPEDARSPAKLWKYLVLWILTNYTLAIIVLVLILPDTLKLDAITSQLAVYCLAVSALPEVSANVRLQLGRSNSRALDLYKYKTKLSGIIIRQMSLSTLQNQYREREYLESHFADDVSKLRRKLTAFVQQSDLPESERRVVLERVLHDDEATSESLLSLLEKGASVRSKMLEFFREDIERFRRSPMAVLLNGLEPRVSVAEARQLVANGITSRWRFCLRTTVSFQRRRLTKRTGISEERLRLVHYSTARFNRERRLARLRVGVVCSILIATIVILISMQANRTSYFPSSADTAEVVVEKKAPGRAEGRGQ